MPSRGYSLPVLAVILFVISVAVALVYRVTH